MHDKLAPVVCIASPLICFCWIKFQQEIFGGFQIGQNSYHQRAIHFPTLLIISKRSSCKAIMEIINQKLKHIPGCLQVCWMKYPPLMKHLTMAERIPHAHMHSGHDAGEVPEMVNRMIKPVKILEIGTFKGFSALYFKQRPLSGRGCIPWIEERGCRSGSRLVQGRPVSMKR